jgi:hypothetical protein
MFGVLAYKGQPSKDCLPQGPNSDEDLTDDQIIDGLTKLTAESLAEDSDY